MLLQKVELYKEQVDKIESEIFKDEEELTKIKSQFD